MYLLHRLHVTCLISLRRSTNQLRIKIIHTVISTTIKHHLIITMKILAIIMIKALKMIIIVAFFASQGNPAISSVDFKNTNCSELVFTNSTIIFDLPKFYTKGITSYSLPPPKIPDIRVFIQSFIIYFFSFPEQSG